MPQVTYFFLFGRQFEQETEEFAFFEAQQVVDLVEQEIGLLDDLDEGAFKHIFVDFEQVVFGDAGAIQQVFFGLDG